MNLILKIKDYLWWRWMDKDWQEILKRRKPVEDLDMGRLMGGSKLKDKKFSTGKKHPKNRQELCPDCGKPMSYSGLYQFDARNTREMWSCLECRRTDYLDR